MTGRFDTTAAAISASVELQVEIHISLIVRPGRDVGVSDTSELPDASAANWIKNGAFLPAFISANTVTIVLFKVIWARISTISIDSKVKVNFFLWLFWG